MYKSLGVFLRIVSLVFDVKGARQPCLTSHHDSTRYGFYLYSIIWSPYYKDDNGRPIFGPAIDPLQRLISHLTVFRDIIKGQQVANPMLHGMVLPLLLSGKVTNQNNNQNITKPTTPNR